MMKQIIKQYFTKTYKSSSVQNNNQLKYVQNVYGINPKLCNIPNNSTLFGKNIKGPIYNIALYVFAQLL